MNTELSSLGIVRRLEHLQSLQKRVSQDVELLSNPSTKSLAQTVSPNLCNQKIDSSKPPNTKRSTQILPWMKDIKSKRSPKRKSKVKKTTDKVEKPTKKKPQSPTQSEPMPQPKQRTEKINQGISGKTEEYIERKVTENTPRAIPHKFQNTHTGPLCLTNVHDNFSSIEDFLKFYIHDGYYEARAVFRACIDHEYDQFSRDLGDDTSETISEFVIDSILEEIAYNLQKERQNELKSIGIEKSGLVVDNENDTFGVCRYEDTRPNNTNVKAKENPIDAIEILAKLGELEIRKRNWDSKLKKIRSNMK